ncbi:helix-turn-helix transcriptional regulator [Azospirillum lipoferum]|uniref:helix-turn-helix transcriptional regulator n=1 Tax=Azospirillum lipoferum TaxID=193 RepID=UPI0005C83164|nr:metalloregulator ArsR/SmtB family transcription factor [Azospirillum lipoferum]
MSSHGLENHGWSPRTVTDKLLTVLKTQGPQTTADLGQALGTTAENMRQQLSRLAAEGLVEARARPRGVGRPAQLWQLTAAGHARFPDSHADLAAQLIRSIAERLGQEALDSVIAARRADTEANYLAELKDVVQVRDRVARLAAIRSREGYMADWWEEADGSLLLVENHCPICAAAGADQGFCRSELAVFQQVVGSDAPVCRVEHILADARRCAYRIGPVAGQVAVPGDAEDR